MGCSGFSLQIIELIPISGDDEIDKGMLRKREDFWIRNLKTKYPYGLNDRMDSEDPTISTFAQFDNSFKRQRGKRLKKANSSRSPRIPAMEFIAKSHHLYATDKALTRRKLVKEIMGGTKNGLNP